MASGLTTVFFLVLFVAPFAVHARGLKQAVSSNCQTGSKATLFLTSGHGFARSTSYCEVEAHAKNDIKKIVKEWVDDVYLDQQTGCTVAYATEVAEGFAKATAKAFTSVAAVAHIEGTGVACAEGFAAGDALAAALVDIAVKVSLDSIEEFYGYSTKAKVEEALDKAVDEASGKAVGRAVAATISSAWASAYQSICTKGELVEEYDESFAYQTREAAAYLFAEVALSLCREIGQDVDEGEWKKIMSDSTSFVTGEITDTEDSQAYGTAGVGDDKPEQCTGMKAAVCCRRSYKKRDTCRCGTRCQMKTYLENHKGSKAKIWEDMTTGDKCLCP